MSAMGDQAEERFPVSPEELELAVHKTQWEILRLSIPITIASVLLVAALYAISLPGKMLVLVLPYTLGVAAAFGVVWWLQASGRLSMPWATAVHSALTLLLFGVVMVRSWAGPGPQQETSYAVLLIATGALAYSRRHLVIIVAAALAGWALMVWITPHKELSASSMLLFQSALFIGVTLHLLHRHLLRRTESLRKAAESAEVAKAQFLMNISHELRTPLNGVLGMAELLRYEELPPEQAEYVDAIRRSGESLLVIVSDILDMTQIESGKLTLRTDILDLAQSVEQSLSLFEGQARQKGLVMRAEIEAGTPTLMVTDPARFRQILLNLIGNAVKFTERGSVSVNVGTRPRAGGGIEIHCSVRDTGIGITPAKQEEIFLPFSWADGSTTRAHGGAGLGLAISRKLVQLLGGKLWLESEVGRGSTFHFTVPARIAAEAASTSASARPLETPATSVVH